MEKRNVKFATPEFAFLPKDTFERVYEPAEDTFLLLDALEADGQALAEQSPLIGIEVGIGSGVVTSFLGRMRAEAGLMSIGVDISHCACDTALRILERNAVPGAFFDVVQGDLLSCCRRSIADLILFNPPYVATSSEELSTARIDSIDRSWAGGRDGREVLDVFFPQACSRLKESSGVLYVVCEKRNRPEEIAGFLSESLGMKTVILKRRRCGNEILYVLRSAAHRRD